MEYVEPVAADDGVSIRYVWKFPYGLLFCAGLLVFLIWLRWQFAQHALTTLPAWSANDGPYWLAAVVEWSNGHGFNNTLTNFYTEAHWRDGEHSLVAYPPLHMLLLAALTATPDVYGVYRAVWILEAVGLMLLCAALVAVVYRTGQQHRIGIWVLVWLGIACAGTLGFCGRPETTFVTVLSLGCLYAAMSDRPNAFVVGLILGVLGASQPLAAMLVSSILVVWFSMIWQWRQATVRLVIVATTSVAVLVVALGTYYDAIDVFNAMRRNVPLQFYHYFSWSLLAKVQFMDYLRPLSGMILLAGGMSAVVLIKNQRCKSVGWSFVGVFSLLVLSGFAFIIRPHNNYNAQALYPIAILLIVLGAAMHRKSTAPLAMAIFIPALAAPLQSWLVLDHAKRGMTLQTAQSAYVRILSVLPADTMLGIDTDLWSLSNDGGEWHRSHHFNWQGPRSRNSNASVLFIREGNALNRSGSLLEKPRQVILDSSKGIRHRLWLDCNTKKLVHVFGREIYSPVMGFAFSVYVPEAWDEWCAVGSECQRQLVDLQNCDMADKFDDI